MGTGFEIEEVKFSYEGRMVFKNLSVTLEPGRFYGIVGPNGCGKTTLIDLLMGYKKPSDGVLRFNGKEIRTFSAENLSREMALVPQNFYINFPFLAGEIVMMGRYPHIPRFSKPGFKDLAIVENIMEKTGVQYLRHRYMTELSGGERQRVVFARALAQDTPWIFLDEATSNLDINHTLNLLDLISGQVARGEKTIVAVMQDINLAAMYCDYLAFVKSGEIAAFGKTRDILTEDRIAQVFNIESKVYIEPFSNLLKVAFIRKTE